MQATLSTAQTQQRPRLRPIALPTEHGGWSMVLEPILLGWCVAFSGLGLLLGIAAFAAFLIRHPFQLAMRDRKRGKRYPRTRWAERFATFYAFIAAGTFLASLVVSDYAFWQPLVIALPLAFVQIGYDLRNQSRALTAEIAGAVAVGAVVSMIALADGWKTDAAFAIWAILIARIVGTIFYVRARLRLERGEQPSIMPAHLTHVAGLTLVIILAVLGLGRWLAVFALTVLLARSVHGLSRFRIATPRAAIIGVQEIMFGIVTVVLVAIGFTFGL